MKKSRRSKVPRGPQIKGLAHIGIAVRNLENSISYWKDILGFKYKGTEEVSVQGVRVAQLEADYLKIELLESLGHRSPVEKFLVRRGPGIHHIALKVENLERAIKVLSNQGCHIIGSSQTGMSGTRIAFVHPKATGGVLLELVEEE